MVVCLEGFRGPFSYTSGGSAFSSLILARIERAQVLGSTTSGLIGKVVPYSGQVNTFKVQFFYPEHVSSGKNEVENETDLSSYEFCVLEEGSFQ
jgi:hypothetical protein